MKLYRVWSLLNSLAGEGHICRCDQHAARALGAQFPWLSCSLTRGCGTELVQFEFTT